jgi:biopolymer transport protein ExbD
MARRESPEINAGSMADIAFLLLIFFLVTTTMDSSYGVSRTLPPIDDEPQEENDQINERNILIVLVNGGNQLLVEGIPTDISELKETVKEFILNENNLKNLPEFKDVSKQIADARVLDLMEEIKNEKNPDVLKVKKRNMKKALRNQLACEIMGRDYKVSMGIISMQNADETTYKTYLNIQDEMASAFFELRNELAIEKIGISFLDCSKEQQNAIKAIYPSQISEAETVQTGK